MPTNNDIERKQNKKDIMQPYHKKHGKPQENKDFIREYGTKAYENKDPELKSHYDKRLATDPKLIHKNNTVQGIDIPKGKKTKVSGCYHAYPATSNGGFINKCKHCGKEYGDRETKESSKSYLEKPRQRRTP